MKSWFLLILGFIGCYFCPSYSATDVSLGLFKDGSDLQITTTNGTSDVLVSRSFRRGGMNLLLVFDVDGYLIPDRTWSEVTPQVYFSHPDHGLVDKLNPGQGYSHFLNLYLKPPHRLLTKEGPFFAICLRLKGVNWRDGLLRSNWISFSARNGRLTSCRTIDRTEISPKILSNLKKEISKLQTEEDFAEDPKFRNPPTPR